MFIGHNNEDPEPSEQESPLARYSDQKQLPIGFLQELGLRNTSYAGLPAIEIPYRDQLGQMVAPRFRIGTAGSSAQFRWPQGTTLIPYGLDRLAEAREQGFVVVVEGESDAQTLWHNGVPALGIPGASAWKNPWSEHLEGIDQILLVVEPDAGGQTLLSKLLESGLRDRLWVVRLDGFKDVSELHIDDPSQFAERWTEALEKVRPMGTTDSEDSELTHVSVSELVDLAGPIDRNATHDEIESWVNQLRKVAEQHKSELYGRMRMFRSAATEILGSVRKVRGPSGIVGEALADLQLGDVAVETLPADPEIDEELRDRASKLIRCEDLLDLACRTMDKRGLVGEEINRKVVFLSCIGGLVGTPIHLAIHGESSGGKNTLVRAATDLLPLDAVIAVTGLSTHALEYRGDRIQGVFVIDEAEGQADAEYQLRVAMSEGRITRLTVNRSASGRNEAEELVIEMAASVITTTTSASLHTENETRLLDLHIDDGVELTRQIIIATADRASGAQQSDTSEAVRLWQIALPLLERREVVIPFASQIARSFPAHLVRARRDFKKVIALIEASALLHQFTRERDVHSRVIASRADYEAVYPLIQAVFGPSMSGLSDKARQLFALLQEGVTQMNGGWQRRSHLEQQASQRKIASPSTVHKWTRRLCDLGFLEARKEKGAWEYRVIRDLESEALPLPRPEDLEPNS